MKRYIIAVGIIAVAYNASASGTVDYHTLSSPIINNTGSIKDPSAIIDVPIDDYKPSKKHIKTEKLLAGVMFGECRGQGESCMISIGHVAMNRAKSNLDKRYGKGLWGVLKKRKAFSCLNPGDPNLKLIQKAMRGKLDPDSPEYNKWKLSLKVAHDLMHRESVDPTKGSTHYHAEYVSPAWKNDRNMNPTVKVSGHVFYRFDS